mgnify:CR=1 FL=1
MWTLRLSVTGTIILMLLAGPGGAVVAADEEALASDRPHQVSGTNAYAGVFENATFGYEDGRVLERGEGAYDTIEMDDARLSGTLWHVWNRDYLGDGEVLTGTVELVNEGGTWVGTMRGYKAYEPDEHLHYWQVELTGTGAYEGYSALLYFRGVTYYTLAVEGYIFPGELPDYPGPVEVPAQ